MPFGCIKLIFSERSVVPLAFPFSRLLSSVLLHFPRPSLPCHSSTSPLSPCEGLPSPQLLLFPRGKHSRAVVVPRFPFSVSGFTLAPPCCVLLFPSLRGPITLFLDEIFHKPASPPQSQFFLLRPSFAPRSSSPTLLRGISDNYGPRQSLIFSLPLCF